MKKMLVALMLIAGYAHAGTVATMTNNAGGLISFTDGQCGPGGGNIATATNDKISTVYGCWKFNGTDTVWVIWQLANGRELREYPLKDLTVNPQWKQQ